MTCRPPWLLLSHREGPERQCFYSVSDHIYGTTAIPQLANKCVVGSSYGWLVLTDHNTNDCCLWNPSMPEMIELPNLDNSFIYNACVLSKPPTDPDCCILFISTRIMNHAFCRQAFCRIGNDNYVKQSLPLQAAIPFEGKMYGLMRFDLQLVMIHFDFIEGKLELRHIPTEGRGSWKILDPFPGLMLTEEGEEIEPWNERYYLIESRTSCGNELLLVHEMTPFSYKLEFRVFRVDFSRMECVELELIGERAIFLSYYGCGFCCSSEGIEENSIYYTVRDSRELNRYDMDVSGRASWEPCPDARVSQTVTYWVEDHVFSYFQI